MDDWRVSVTGWNLSGDGFHKCLFGPTAKTILFAQCFPVVGQHQRTEPHTPAVPEVTVRTGYRSGFNPGWYYHATWVSPEGARQNASEGGFSTREEAKEEARDRATRAIRAQLPEETYTFTPKI